MPIGVVGAISRGVKGKIVWVLEDIWLYSNGDAEVLVEGIVEVPSPGVVDSIRIFMPWMVEDVENQTQLCGDDSFVSGYPRCWTNIYFRYEISSVKPKRVTVNGHDALVAPLEIQTLLHSHCTEIMLNFIPPIESDKRIFRLAMVVKGLAKPSNRILPSAKKIIMLNTYGVAPFGGEEIMALLAERQMNIISDIYDLSHYTILLNFWGKVEIVQSTVPSTSEWDSGVCHMLERFCPALERQSKRLSIPVKTLKNTSSHSMIWKEKNIDGAGGTTIRIIFSESRIQRWIHEHWLALIAIGLGATGVTLGLINLLHK